MNAKAVDADAARKLQNQYQNDGVSLSKDGLLIASAKWQSALQELTITVNIASNSPTLAGDTITLDKEALTALAENDGHGPCPDFNGVAAHAGRGLERDLWREKRAVPVRVLRQGLDGDRLFDLRL